MAQLSINESLFIKKVLKTPPEKRGELRYPKKNPINNMYHSTHTTVTNNKLSLEGNHICELRHLYGYSFIEVIF